MQTLLHEASRLEIAAPLVVSLLVLARVYLGSVLFHPRYAAFWNVVRRIAVPVIEVAARKHLASSPSLTNHAEESEFVGTTDLSTNALAKQLSTARDVEVPLLAGFKTDWLGRAESGTLVWYYGERLLPALPNWLRPYQVHITLFDDTVTAHREANPYAPWLWYDHLFKGQSFDAEDGVKRTRRALDDAEIDYSTDEPDEPDSEPAEVELTDDDLDEISGAVEEVVEVIDPGDLELSDYNDFISEISDQFDYETAQEAWERLKEAGVIGDGGDGSGESK